MKRSTKIILAVITIVILIAVLDVSKDQYCRICGEKSILGGHPICREVER